MASKKTKKPVKKTIKKSAAKKPVKKASAKKPPQVKAGGVTKSADRIIVVHAEQDTVAPIVTH